MKLWCLFLALSLTHPHCTEKPINLPQFPICEIKKKKNHQVVEKMEVVEIFNMCK